MNPFADVPAAPLAGGALAQLSLRGLHAVGGGLRLAGLKSVSSTSKTTGESTPVWVESRTYYWDQFVRRPTFLLRQTQVIYNPDCKGRF